ncbi:putative FmdB family regulatory protein [Krasilnikovia cinnamomea]|uniref:Putative FmdB family regulatory protein n=1 Tax=Krasilnikovia cinnamomea TaxID=349313 RepID=A0A4Q7ZJ79_9ACTN|nr:putative FmdB family regulatory protein [Krasilnikovia cinnamomea]
MPTYQYACTECGEQLEAVQSFSDPALTECPACQGRLRKVFNSVGIVFKGSGFYRNDSRSGNGGSGKPTTSSEPKPEAAKSDTSKSDAAKPSSDSSTSSKTSASSASSSSSTSAPAAASA